MIAGYRSTHHIIKDKIKAKMATLGAYPDPDITETFNVIPFLLDEVHPFKVNLLAEQLTDQYDIGYEISNTNYISIRNKIKQVLQDTEREILHILDVDYLAKRLVRHSENEEYRLEVVNDKLYIFIYKDLNEIRIGDNLHITVINPQDDESISRLSSEMAIKVKEVENEWHQLISKRQKTGYK